MYTTFDPLNVPVGGTVVGAYSGEVYRVIAEYTHHSEHNRNREIVLTPAHRYTMMRNPGRHVDHTRTVDGPSSVLRSYWGPFHRAE